MLNAPHDQERVGANDRELPRGAMKRSCAGAHIVASGTSFHTTIHGLSTVYVLLIHGNIMLSYSSTAEGKKIAASWDLAIVCQEVKFAESGSGMEPMNDGSRN